MGSGTTQEEQLSADVLSVYASVSCLLWLNKVIIRDCLGKFPKFPRHFHTGSMEVLTPTPHLCLGVSVEPQPSVVLQ